MANKEELIELLADKYKLTPNQIEKAVDSQFKFLAKKMATDEKPEIRLPYFGIFKTDKYLMNKLNKQKEDNDKNN